MKKQLMTLLISILVFEPAFCMESATDMSSENSGVALENSGFKTVPPEIIQKIFAHLPYSDLSKAARVCKEFNNNARDPIFRNEVIKKMSKEEVDTYLILATKKGHEPAVKELQPYASEVGINNALDEAATNGHTNIVGMLRNDSRITPNGINNALHSAAIWGRTSVVEMLLSDSRVTEICINKWALGSAASNGRAPVVEILLKNFRVTQGGITNALRDAASNGYARVVGILLNDSRVKRKSINIALFWAAARGHANVVEILLKDSRVTRNRIHDSLRDAANYGHANVVEMLRNWIAQNDVDGALYGASK